MVIDKIGNINNINKPAGSRPANKATKAGKTDKVEISSDAKKAAETAKFTQLVKETPDIRREKVEAIKAQIKDGTYDKFLDTKVLEMVADKIATNLLRK